MMSEVSNRFGSVLENGATGTAINTTFTVPAGHYFRGQVTYYFVSGGANTSCGISKSGIFVAILGPSAAVPAGSLYTQNIPVILNEGTYSVVTIQGGTSSTVSWHGLCFRK